MKIIIAYASAGGGHFKAAEAIYNYFKTRNNLEVKITDVLRGANPLFRNAYIHGYYLFVRYLPWLWSACFRFTYAQRFRKFSKWLATLTDRLNTAGFRQFLIKENADYIICTHFLPPEIAGFLKRTKKINSKIVTVITDFGVHPFWICESTDIYAVASDYTKEQLSLQGINQESIRVVGIPIDLKFSQNYDKVSLCHKLGIDANKFTVLITTGSFSMGPIEEIVDSLYKEVQLIVVCAHNKNLYRRLKQRAYPSVLVCGFINNIEELMGVCDITIAKPGGLTIAENLSMGLPLLFITAIPGQETENIKFLSENGVGTCVEDIAGIKSAILDLKHNPAEIAVRKEKIRKIKKPFAVRELYNVIC